MSGLEARSIVEAQIRRELFGPLPGDKPKGEPIDCSSGRVEFRTLEETRGQFHDTRTLEEILTIGNPLTRYGIGVLHGGASQIGPSVEGLEVDDLDLMGVSGLARNEDDPTAPPVHIQRPRHDEADSDDFDLTDANSFRPSAMGISFACRLPVGGKLRIELTGAHYDRIEVQVADRQNPFEWWCRRPFSLSGTVGSDTLLTEIGALRVINANVVSGEPRIIPGIRVLSRLLPGQADQDVRLITVVAVNDAGGTGPASAFFQMGFNIYPEGGVTFESYPEVTTPDRDEEEQSINLLYRKKKTYAIGHGCAAVWASDHSGQITSITAEALPAYEVVSLTPNVYQLDAKGNFILDSAGKRIPVVVSMKELSEGTSAGSSQIDSVIRLYEKWIADRRLEIPNLPEQLQPAASLHMERAEKALSRMKEGWSLVQSEPIARKAFQWANKAMLYQQIRSSLPLRRVDVESDGRWRPVGSHPEPVIPEGRGNWRPFQIAFVLATLPELVDPTRGERSTVDLIFFPTGGGKTEAYLGAFAISLLSRRLRNPDDDGTEALMRYTLRLLTAQQFLRASSLICVLEDIRDQNVAELGASPFGIGIWLGGSSTPNTWRQAVGVLGRLRKNSMEQNLFLLLRCPWCGTEMGTKSKGKGEQVVIGYEQFGNKVVLRCQDSQCKFSRRSGLPVHVVDEDIYAVRPSLVIGTVDKFAMMSWLPQARSLFGLDANGTRKVSPPNLIIQDELHLISGPLGSMVGLFEPVIDELATDRRGGSEVPPKIIASTATIRRYEDQIRGIFGRNEVALFPPHGLEEGHSFFAGPARTASGELEPGRRYLGLMSPSLGSMQTLQTRVAAATLQAAMDIPEKDRDGYWTNLNFLNSLRELGNTVSLLQSDVPDYLTGLMRRDGIQPRYPSPTRTMELTSRRRSDEIPKAIEQLQLTYVPGKERQDAVDICLASNIIEVGIDIERLGLMTIVGQPKTTAQYIQVSGRVGRRPDVSPGLVVTLYGAAKPRDRSHYERFMTYHQQLYAQVEPTSVTPFASPVLQRALHAVAVSFIRQTSDLSLAPYPFPEEKYKEAIEIVRRRAAITDPDELAELDRIARSRAREWASWERTVWEANPPPAGDPKQGLMRYAGTLPDLDSRAVIWDVPTSMRNVDAECRLSVSLAYLSDVAEEEREA